MRAGASTQRSRFVDFYAAQKAPHAATLARSTFPGISASIAPINPVGSRRSSSTFSRTPRIPRIWGPQNARSQCEPPASVCRTADSPHRRIRVPHPFALFLANGWERTRPVRASRERPLHAMAIYTSPVIPTLQTSAGTASSHVLHWRPIPGDTRGPRAPAHPHYRRWRLHRYRACQKTGSSQSAQPGSA